MENIDDIKTKQIQIINDNNDEDDEDCDDAEHYLKIRIGEILNK